MKKLSLQTTLPLIFCVLVLTFFTFFTGVSCRTYFVPNREVEVIENASFKETTNEDNSIKSQENGENNEDEAAGQEHEENIINGVEEIPPEMQNPQPNELGEVMILMYHEIGYPEGEWRRTPENFRRDLEILYTQGYRTISLSDLVRGTINIPAGTSPVVLTFDDGNKGNFYYSNNNNNEGEPAPDCAVAIMENFYAEKPDFGLNATFFIYYPNPFREPQHIEKKLNYLVAKGFEIGNHTYSHANLSQLNPTAIQRELALHVQATREYVPGYEVNSLALPYGGYPGENASLLFEGSYEGITYRNEAVLLVGANPSVSPFHQKINNLKLPRIRASELKTEGVGLYDWLDYFQQNPHKRYISDGNPDFVTFPETWSEFLNEAKLKDKKARFY